MSDTIVDGNSQTDGQPTREAHTSHIMDPLGAGAFGVQITTTDVKAGFNNIQTVSLQAPDGSKIFCEHHEISVLSTPVIKQDVPPGETQAKP